ncbi:hypothetical protein BGZ61DRAFT_485224 [Ilyonectria robusta]|uniref:uncharacterized protein n=1 Tax=Ilyonectria robusta TaxID=1079257 RepID=UPI001E8E0E50|nr:uncharacterized protein BGZ61DRAFT_485224 [Ilyonectria robusta]KAH8662770.1 hypothetical protein BGZ61DRAFT_485224 [Ilyonectria robusta]
MGNLVAVAGPTGGAAYYFAKKSINADRAARLDEQRKRKSTIEYLEYSQKFPSKTTIPRDNGCPVMNNNVARALTITAGSPGQESSSDPAASKPAPATEDQAVFEKGNHESSTRLRSPK